MGIRGGTVHGPSWCPRPAHRAWRGEHVERALEYDIRAVGATAARMLRTGVAGSAGGEGRPGTPSVALVRVSEDRAALLLRRARDEGDVPGGRSTPAAPPRRAMVRSRA